MVVAALAALRSSAQPQKMSASSASATASAPIETLAVVDAATPVSVDVHAVVLLSILDHHLRRAERPAGDKPGGPPAAAQDRAIGVLLGSNVGGIVEVTNSFGVLHIENKAAVRAVGGGSSSCACCMCPRRAF